VRRIDRDRRENGIDAAGEKQIHGVAASVVEISDREYAYALSAQGGN
jgi:hypothetical protein